MGKLNRREFLQIGAAGATTALLGWEGVAEAARSASSGSFSFPRPVYRTLGRTGLNITVISFGAMLTPEAEVLETAFDHGVNYVDTARVYMGGRNEEIVGRALKGRRDRVYVATKTTGRSGKQVIRDVETSLKMLETDRIDVIQLHSISSTQDRIFNADIREALLKLRQQGKVRFFGVTSHSNEAEVLHALVDDRDRFFDVALVKYNFESDAATTKALARAAGAGVGIVAMKSLAGGYRTDTPGPISPCQAALKWVLKNRNVAAIIPGMRDMAELREDIAVMGMKFGPLDRYILDRYRASIDSVYCRFCGACEAGCPFGVEISTVNRSLMYAEAYREEGLARETYRQLPVSSSASVCLDCRTCTAKCVHGLDIRAKMERAWKLLG